MTNTPTVGLLDLVLLAAVGVGGYFAYTHFKPAARVPATTTPTTGTGAGTPTPGTPGIPTTGTTQSNGQPLPPIAAPGPDLLAIERQLAEQRRAEEERRKLEEERRRLDQITAVRRELADVWNQMDQLAVQLNSIAAEPVPWSLQEEQRQKAIEECRRISWSIVDWTCPQQYSDITPAMKDAAAALWKTQLQARMTPYQNQLSAADARQKALITNLKELGYNVPAVDQRAGTVLSSGTTKAFSNSPFAGLFAGMVASAPSQPGRLQPQGSGTFAGVFANLPHVLNSTL